MVRPAYAAVGAREIFSREMIRYLACSFVEPTTADRFIATETLGRGSQIGE